VFIDNEDRQYQTAGGHGLRFYPVFDERGMDIFWSTREDLRNVHQLPFAGFSYLIEPSSFVSWIDRQPDIVRIHHLRQWGYLIDPFNAHVNPGHEWIEFVDHSRGLHSRDATALATRHALSEGTGDATVRHRQAAMMFHDSQMPGGGDSLKRLDPTALDEDDRLPAYFESNAWQAIEQQGKLDRERMLATMKDPIIGWLDRIGYTARDLRQFIPPIALPEPVRHRVPHDLLQLEKLALRHPRLCDMWQTLSTRNGVLVCTDGLRLYRFLKARLYMFRLVYAHPVARTLEMTIIQPIASELYRCGILNPTNLLRNSDNSIDDMIGSVLGGSTMAHAALTMAYTYGSMRFATFATEYEARAHAANLVRAGRFPTVIEHLQPYLKRSSTLPIELPDGRIVPFATAHPDLEAELKRLELLDEPWALYWLDAVSNQTTTQFRELIKVRARTFL